MASESKGISVKFHRSRGRVFLHLSDGSVVRDAIEWETHPRNETVKLSEREAA